MPLVLNLLGAVERVAWSMGLERVEELEELGSRLALLQQPKPPKGLKELTSFRACSGIWSKPDPTVTSPHAATRRW